MLNEQDVSQALSPTTFGFVSKYHRHFTYYMAKQHNIGVSTIFGRTHCMITSSFSSAHLSGVFGLGAAACTCGDHKMANGCNGFLLTCGEIPWYIIKFNIKLLCSSGVPNYTWQSEEPIEILITKHHSLAHLILRHTHMPLVDVVFPIAWGTWASASSIIMIYGSPAGPKTAWWIGCGAPLSTPLRGLPPFQRTHFKDDRLGSYILDNPLDLYEFLQLRSAKSLYDPNNWNHTG